MNLPLSLRALGAMVLAAVLATALVAPVTASAKPKRPSVKVVKRVITEHWDTDGTGPNYTTLEFHKVTRGKVRRRHVNELAPADWVTPVIVKFTQTITYGPGPGQRDVAVITQRALFYKGALNWAFHSKGADIKYIERM